MFSNWQEKIHKENSVTVMLNIYLYSIFYKYTDIYHFKLQNNPKIGFITLVL